MASIIDRALPFWFACRDYRTSYSSFVKQKAKEQLWEIVTTHDGPVKAAATKAMKDLKLIVIQPVSPNGAA